MITDAMTPREALTHAQETFLQYKVLQPNDVTKLMEHLTVALNENEELTALFTSKYEI